MRMQPCRRSALQLGSEPVLGTAHSMLVQSEPAAMGINPLNDAKMLHAPAAAQGCACRIYAYGQWRSACSSESTTKRWEDAEQNGHHLLSYGTC